MRGHRRGFVQQVRLDLLDPVAVELEDAIDLQADAVTAVAGRGARRITASEARAAERRLLGRRQRLPAVLRTETDGGAPLICEAVALAGFDRQAGEAERHGARSAESGDVAAVLCECSRTVEALRDQGAGRAGTVGLVVGIGELREERPHARVLDQLRAAQRHAVVVGVVDAIETTAQRDAAARRQKERVAGRQVQPPIGVEALERIALAVLRIRITAVVGKVGLEREPVGTDELRVTDRQQFFARVVAQKRRGAQLAAGHDRVVDDAGQYRPRRGLAQVCADRDVVGLARDFQHQRRGTVGGAWQ